MKKLLQLVALGVVAVLLSSCGGGGGDPGSGPHSDLRITPEISAVTIAVDEEFDIVEVSQGVKPYFVGADTDAVEVTLIGGNTVHVKGIKPGSGEVWVQDDSNLQTTISIAVTVPDPDMD